MATGYGYATSPSYGYTVPKRTLAGAAAGTNPFGLASGYNPAAYVPGGSSPLVSAAIQKAGMKPPAAAPGAAGPKLSLAGLPTSATAGVTAAGKTLNTAPTSNAVYDLSTDPILQSTLSMAGMSDEQAQAAAGKARRDLLQNYGDPTLSSAVLGDPTLAAAAAANPTSTVKQLKQNYDTGVGNLTEQLNQANLLYSGYRTTQETKAATDYQNALASAAAGVNTGLDQISGSLSSALGQNEAQRQQAASDAYSRQLQELLLNPPQQGGQTLSQFLGGTDFNGPLTIGSAGGGGITSTSGATQFTPAQLAQIAAMPANQPAAGGYNTGRWDPKRGVWVNG